MITSIHNPKIKRVCALQQKQKDRKTEKCFVVEGKKMMEEAPKELIEEIYITEAFMKANKSYLDYFPLERCEIVSEKVLKHMSTFVTEQGILGVLKQQNFAFSTLNLEGNPLFIALENLQDPGNMGTIIRTADAVNARGIIISTGSVDIYNPKVVRATMGSIFRVPILVDVDIIKTLKRLKDNNINVYAAHLKGQVYYDEVQYLNGTCFLIGNEGNGLTNETAECADQFVKIPILSEVESLNASIAAGVLMYEAVRQRRCLL